MAAARYTTKHHLFLWVLLGVSLVGCGASDASGPSGVYVPKYPDQPFTFIDKLDFQGGGKVVVIAMGDTAAGDYIVTEDGHVRITTPAGAGATFKLADDGCLLAESDPGMVAEAAKDGMDLNELGLYCPD